MEYGQAYLVGYNSYKRGKKMKNPYRFGTTDYDDFRHGWNAAEFDDNKSQ